MRARAGVPGPLGAPPFWAEAQIVTWRYRRRTWAPGMPETAVGVRVVRDDPAGLVAWLAPGSPMLRPERADGRSIRADPATMFTAPRRQGHGVWHSDGILRIVPAGRPWSVWLFHHDPPAGARSAERGPFRCWYVNLEDPAVRSGDDLLTSDLVLDLVIAPDGTVTRKDADELALAVQQGRFTRAEADRIEQHADEAEQSFVRGDWPFAATWTSWLPPAHWTVPDAPTQEDS